jgi:hypothetical protein
MMVDSYTQDSTDIEFLSLYVCAICGRRLYPGDERYKIADVFLCGGCNCNERWWEIKR